MRSLDCDDDDDGGKRFGKKVCVCATSGLMQGADANVGGVFVVDRTAWATSESQRRA